MKRIAHLFIALIVVGSWSLSAQQRNGDQDREKRREQIQARKIGMITDALDLTTEQAQKFWPVYNEFSKEMEVIHDSRRENMEKFKDAKGDLSDDEIEEMIQNRFETEQNILDLQKKYHKRFTEVLTMNQVGKLYMTEERFKQMLLQEMRGPRDGQGPHDGPRGSGNGSGTPGQGVGYGQGNAQGQGPQQGNGNCDPSNCQSKAKCKS